MRGRCVRVVCTCVCADGNLAVHGETVGMVPRAARYLFERIEQLKGSQPDMKVKVIATFCEVYNEQVGVWR